MAHSLTGHQFLSWLAELPLDELDEPASTLLERYDGPCCDDCGRRHATVDGARACDLRAIARTEFADARARMLARRALRARSRGTEPDDEEIAL